MNLLSNWNQILRHYFLVAGVAILIPVLQGCGKAKLDAQVTTIEGSGSSLPSVVPNFTINDGRLFTNERTLSISIQNEFETEQGLRLGFRQIFEQTLSLGEACKFNDWVTTSDGQLAFTIPETAKEGEFQICAQFQEKKQEAAPIATQGLVLDEQEPFVSSLTSSYLNKAKLEDKNNIDLQGKVRDNLSGIKILQLSVKHEKTNKCYTVLPVAGFLADCPHWEEIHATDIWSFKIPIENLSNGDFYSTSIQAIDKAGNRYLRENHHRFRWMSDGAASADFVINNDAVYTADLNVSIKLLSDNLVKSYRIAEGASCDNATWQTYTTNNFPFTLSGGDGEKLVCLQVKDAAGELSIPVVKSIILDQSDPSPNFTINLAATYTNDTNVTLSLADANGVAEYRKADGSDCSAAVWTSYGGPIPHSLPAGDGVKEVCLQVRDSFLNASATVTDTITLSY